MKLKRIRWAKKTIPWDRRQRYSAAKVGGFRLTTKKLGHVRPNLWSWDIIGPGVRINGTLDDDGEPRTEDEAKRAAVRRMTRLVDDFAEIVEG